MDIKVNYNGVTNKDDAFQVVEDYITPDNLKKFQVDAEFDYDKAGDKIVASGKGFTLTINFFEDRVEAKLDLAFILKPLRKKIVSVIEREMQKRL